MSSDEINKRQLHHYYTKLRAVKPWYFLLIGLIFLGLSVYGLRQNNLKMVELREKVAQADKSGQNVETALANLRNYVYSHMNTDLSGGAHSIDQPIQLKHRYERLVKQRSQSIEQENEQIKKRGEAICARKHPAGGFNSPRVACVQDYVQQNAKKASDIPEELYKFDFASPKWTPDFAGITLVLGVFFTILSVIWLGLTRWAKAKLK